MAWKGDHSMNKLFWTIWILNLFTIQIPTLVKSCPIIKWSGIWMQLEYSGGLESKQNTKQVRYSDGSKLFGSSPAHSKTEQS